MKEEGIMLTPSVCYIRTCTSNLARELLKYVNSYSFPHKVAYLFAGLDSELVLYQVLQPFQVKGSNTTDTVVIFVC